MKKVQKHENDTTSTGKHKRWVFTWFNFTETDIKYLSDVKFEHNFNYLVFGFEICPTTKNPHLQGYVEFSCPYTMVTVKNKLDPINKKASPVQVKPADKCRLANFRYCSKDGKYIEINHVDKSQNQDDPYTPEMNFLIENPNFSDFMLMYPETAIKHHAGINNIINQINNKHNETTLIAQYDCFIPKKWQASLMNDLNTVPHPRKIIWIWENVGNVGKTYMAMYLAAVHKAAYLQNGKSSDLAHAYNGQNIVVFDFPRTSIEKINYSIIESLKNGIVFSPKYNSQTKVFPTPHVVIFANFPPNRSALSQDRWDIREITSTDTVSFRESNSPENELDNVPVL